MDTFLGPSHICFSFPPQADQIERRQKQDSDGGTRGPRGHTGGRRGEDSARVEIWIRPTGHPGVSRTAGSESGKDSEQDGELGTLSASDVSAQKTFFLFLTKSRHKPKQTYSGTQMRTSGEPERSSRVVYASLSD